MSGTSNDSAGESYQHQHTTFSRGGRGRGGRGRGVYDYTRRSCKDYRSRQQRAMTGRGLNVNEEPMYIRSCYVGSVIGRKGKNIRALQSKSGAKIWITETENFEGKREIKFWGPSENRSKAKLLLEDFIKHLERFFPDPGQRMSGGGGGADMTRTIRSHSHCPISIPNPIPISTLPRGPLENDWNELNRISEEAQQEKWSALKRVQKKFLSGGLERAKDAHRRREPVQVFGSLSHMSPDHKAVVFVGRRDVAESIAEQLAILTFNEVQCGVVLGELERATRDQII